MKQKIIDILKGEYLSTFIMVGFVQVVGMGLNYGVNIWLTNNLSVKEFGVWSYSFQTIIMVFMAFALVGNPKFIIREVIRSITAKNWTAFKITLKRSIKFSSIAMVITSILLYLAVPILYKNEVPSQKFILFLIVYGVVYSIGRLRQSYQQATGHNKYSQIPERIVQPVLFMIAIFFFGINQEWTVDNVIVFYTFSSLVAVFGSLFFIKKLDKLILENRDATPVISNKKHVTRKYFFIISVLDIVDSSVDLYLIQELGFEEVAFYSVSKRIATLIQMLLVASNFTISPLINVHFIKGEKAKLQSRIYKVIGLNILLATLMMVGLLLTKDFLLGLFKAEYIEGVSFSLFFLTLLAQWFNVFFGMPGVLLAASGNERYASYVYGIAILIQLVAGKLVIPVYGVEGMALVYVVNTIFWNLAMAIIARKKTGLKSSFVS